MPTRLGRVEHLDLVPHGLAAELGELGADRLHAVGAEDATVHGEPLLHPIDTAQEERIGVAVEGINQLEGKIASDDHDDEQVQEEPLASREMQLKRGEL